MCDYVFYGSARPSSIRPCIWALAGYVKLLHNRKKNISKAEIYSNISLTHTHTSFHFLNAQILQQISYKCKSMHKSTFQLSPASSIIGLFPSFFLSMEVSHTFCNHFLGGVRGGGGWKTIIWVVHRQAIFYLSVLHKAYFEFIQGHQHITV